MASRSEPARRPATTAFFAFFAFFGSVTAAGIVAIACGLDAEGTKEPPVDPPDATPLFEAATIPKGDASPGLDGGRDADATTGCPKGSGPSMVRMPDAGFCIDSTEVTNQQYDDFLAATAGGATDAGIPEGGLAPRCNGIKTFKRSGPAADAGVTTPVASIPWCAAAAYCAWAGKRLCRGGVFGTPDAGEWFEACSDRGTRLYPYGNTPDSGICNDFPGAGTVIPVASRPGCVGGIPGVFDMTGNVVEFIDNCNGASDASSCVAQGSYFNGSGGCSAAFEYSTGFTDVATGVRCCADVR